MLSERCKRALIKAIGKAARSEPEEALRYRPSEYIQAIIDDPEAAPAAKVELIRNRAEAEQIVAGILGLC